MYNFTRKANIPCLCYSRRLNAKPIKLFFAFFQLMCLTDEISLLFFLLGTISIFNALFNFNFLYTFPSRTILLPYKQIIFSRQIQYLVRGDKAIIKQLCKAGGGDLGGQRPYDAQYRGGSPPKKFCDQDTNWSKRGGPLLKFLRPVSIWCTNWSKGVVLS